MQGRSIRRNESRQSAISVGEQTDAITFDLLLLGHLVFPSVGVLDRERHVEADEEQLRVGDWRVVSGIDDTSVPLILRLR